jgi:hypothetical protein
MTIVLSLEQRVITVVLDWADPVPFPVKKSSSLRDLWGTRSDTVPFPDPAMMPLIEELQKEFKTGTDARILTALTTLAFDAGGSITTLNDLITWIDDAPTPSIVQTSAIG